MEIKVRVEGQVLRVEPNEDIAAPYSRKFLKYKFDLSDDWSGLTIFAQFSQNGHGYNVYLDGSNTVSFPQEIKPGVCFLMLYGTGSGSVIATSHALRIKVHDNGFVADGQSTVITPSLYEQLIDQFLKMVATPNPATTASQMTDHNKIYVYMGSESGYSNGYLYYWNGSSWTRGNLYTSAFTESALSLTSQYPVQAKAVTIPMYLLSDMVPNTIEEYVYTGKLLTQILHKSGNTAIRTDTFTYGDNTITEVRRLNTGGSLTIVTTLDTLSTTVTYSAS